MNDIIEAWKIISPFVTLDGDDIINGRPIEDINIQLRKREQFLVEQLMSGKLSSDDQKHITMLYGCTVRLIDNLNNGNATIIDPKNLQVT